MLNLLLRAALLLISLTPHLPTGSAHGQTADADAARAAHASLLRSAAESRSKGASTAPVLVYEIADFQCPHCARFANDVFPRIDSSYVSTGRVQWVFVNLPMPTHMNAWVAAEAALCAGAVADQFWAMHHRLFETVAVWAVSAEPGQLFARYAREAGVPADAYQACVANDRVAPLILQDVIFGSRVSGTPTFIVDNETTVVGVKTFEEWREILDAALKKRGREE
jgi:protein-disulfide isomerase